MKKALVDMFSSKKALAAMAGTAASAIVLLAGKQGYALDAAAAQSLVQVILGLVAAYVLGQGVADFGKEKEKVIQAISDVVSTAEELPEAPAPEVLTEDA
jgi:proteasome assembly chaperone (PAC2) family protein